MTAAERHSADPILAFSQLVHDLKNQLSIVIAASDALARLLPQGVGVIEVEALVKSAERAATLTEEILVGAMIGAGGGLEPRPPVDLSAATRMMMSTLRRILGDRVEVRLRESYEPAAVFADMIQLERILINLALNARDAMPEGGRLTIEIATIPAALRGAGSAPTKVRLMVTDTGCGMTPEVKGRMFEPLFTTKLRGTGLGLTSVATTVRQLEGTIAVDSVVGRGTTVMITLPLAPDQ